MNIHYRFDLDNGPSHEFDVDLERNSQAHGGEVPAWTALGVHQCRNCPLKAERSPHCPPAVDLQEVVAAFAEIMSYQTATVTVTTPERQIVQHCDVQTGLSALLGLIMASSGCPILGRMRGLARTHLPFQTTEETAFRFIGGWFLRQHLSELDGETPDWSLNGLSALFDELLILNQDFKARLQTAARQDAAMNAISALAMHTMGVQLSLDDTLDELRPYALPPLDPK